MCSDGCGSTVIPFGGRAHLSAARLGGSHIDEVRFTAGVTRYEQFATKYLTTTVSIRRKESGTWCTVHAATAKGRKGYSWTATDAKCATYRGVRADGHCLRRRLGHRHAVGAG